MLVYNDIHIHHSCLQQVAIVTTIEHLGYVEQYKEIWEGGGKEGRLRKGRGEEGGGEGKEGGREERGSHKFNKVSCLHCLQQLLWPRSQVGDDCRATHAPSQQNKKYHSPGRDKGGRRRMKCE